MKTDPLSDAWDFLIGAQPDQRGAGRAAMAVRRAVRAAPGGELRHRADRLAAAAERPASSGTGAVLGWLFRVLIGIMWFQGSLWKMPFPVAERLPVLDRADGQERGLAVVRPIVSDYMLPNMAIVDPLVFAIEMGLAISLMLGLFVRPVATLGAIYVLGLWIGLYRHPDEWPWEYIFLSAVQGMFAVVGGGYSFGLDAAAHAALAPAAISDRPRPHRLQAPRSPARRSRRSAAMAMAKTGIQLPVPSCSSDAMGPPRIAPMPWAM